MQTKTEPAGIPTLATVMPGHQFGEHHSGIVEAPPTVVWEALQRMRWTDLRVTRPLMALRGLGGKVLRDRVIETFTDRAGAVLAEEAPRALLLVMVGKPWSLVPQRIQMDSFDEVKDFSRPGWLKYGMEWALHPLAEDRTLVETRTLCEATDQSARRRFGSYWVGIRWASGLVRLDMISALRRLSAADVKHA